MSGNRGVFFEKICATLVSKDGATQGQRKTVETVGCLGGAWAIGLKPGVNGMAMGVEGLTPRQ